MIVKSFFILFAYFSFSWLKAPFEAIMKHVKKCSFEHLYVEFKSLWNSILCEISLLRNVERTSKIPINMLLECSLKRDITVNEE